VRNIPEVVERIISRIERKTNLFGRVDAVRNIPEVVERCCGIEAHIHWLSPGHLVEIFLEDPRTIMNRCGL